MGAVQVVVVDEVIVVAGADADAVAADVVGAADVEPPTRRPTTEGNSRLQHQVAERDRDY